MPIPDGVTELIFGVVLGAILATPVAVGWAVGNGRRLGKIVGTRVPGDAVEKWLIEFVTAFAEGLRSTITVSRTEGVIRLEVPTGPKSGS